MLICSSLSWTNYITDISSKRKLLGLLYCHFYCHTDSSIFFTTTLLEHCSFLKKYNTLSIYYVVSIGPRTTLLFSLSFSFHLYLHAAEMSNIFYFKLLHNNLDFPSNLLPCQPTPSYNHRPFHLCNHLQIPNKLSLHTSPFPLPLQGSGTIFLITLKNLIHIFNLSTTFKIPSAL